MHCPQLRVRCFYVWSAGCIRCEEQAIKAIAAAQARAARDFGPSVLELSLPFPTPGKVWSALHGPVSFLAGSEVNYQSTEADVEWIEGDG